MVESYTLVMYRLYNTEPVFVDSMKCYSVWHTISTSDLIKFLKCLPARSINSAKYYGPKMWVVTTPHITRSPLYQKSNRIESNRKYKFLGFDFKLKFRKVCSVH